MARRGGFSTTEYPRVRVSLGEKLLIFSHVQRHTRGHHTPDRFWVISPDFTPKLVSSRIQAFPTFAIMQLTLSKVCSTGSMCPNPEGSPRPRSGGFHAFRTFRVEHLTQTIANGTGYLVLTLICSA